MNLYLLENHFTKIPFRVFGNPTTTATGCANFFLRDNELSPTGTGKLRQGRFPWRVYPKQESPEVFCFKLYISFVVTKAFKQEGIVTPATLDTEVGGDIAELVKYVFLTGASQQDLNLQLNASLEFVERSTIPSQSGEKNTIYIQNEMRAFLHDDGTIQFLASCNIDSSAAYKISSHAARASEFSTNLTMELVRKSSMTPSLSSSPSSLQELNERILRKKIKSDFVLISENGVEMPCHQNFLAAHSPAFETSFENQPNQLEQNRHKLNLSEEGLKAFLEFVYCLKLDIPREKSSVALELLETGIKKQMPILTKAINDLLIDQPDDWFKFDAALQLFLHSIQVQGYEELKSKAVKAMKLKRDEMANSVLCQHLLRTDPKSTMILLNALSGP